MQVGKNFFGNRQGLHFKNYVEFRVAHEFNIVPSVPPIASDSIAAWLSLQRHQFHVLKRRYRILSIKSFSWLKDLAKTKPTIRQKRTFESRRKTYTSNPRHPIVLNMCLFSPPRNIAQRHSPTTSVSSARRPSIPLSMCRIKTAILKSPLSRK